MNNSRPYGLRLIALGAVVAAIAALTLSFPRLRPTPQTHELPKVFGKASLPYHYFDEATETWLSYTYFSRPVFQDPFDDGSKWTPGELGCYTLTPKEEWDAMPDLRNQVVELMSRFGKGTYSFDGGTLAGLPSFSATCEAGQEMLDIWYVALGQHILGLASPYGAWVHLAKEKPADPEDPFNWCRTQDRSDFGCYRIDDVLLHEMGHVLGLQHSAPGIGPDPALTIMSVSSSSGPDEGSPRFGRCDMAGLQARYGLAGPDSTLSACLPPLSTRVTLAASDGRLSATVAIDASTLATAQTEVKWYARGPTDVRLGHWVAGGLDGQLVHRAAAVELWVRETSGRSVLERRIGAMSYAASPQPSWAIEVPSGGPATYFARFVGDGVLLADDSDPLTA